MTLSLIGPAAMLLVLGAVRVGLVRPLSGFLLFLLLWAASGILSVALAYRALRAGGDWRWHALVAALVLASFLAVALRSRGPAIHDITTAPDDPPRFVHAPSLDENAGRDLSYPDGPAESAEIQRRTYADLEPLRLPASVDATYAAARAAAADLGWRLTWEDLPGGRFEATATSALFRFTDDIAVRVTSADDGAVVDVRSTSRVGRSDLGANAARIRSFLERLRRRVGGGERG